MFRNRVGTISSVVLHGRPVIATAISYFANHLQYTAILLVATVATIVSSLLWRGSRARGPTFSFPVHMESPIYSSRFSLSCLGCFCILVPGVATWESPGDESVNSAAQHAVDVANDIEPLLSHYGDNLVGSHGKASRQNGFKLFLLGFSKSFDHHALAIKGRGRRVSSAAPDKSLLHTKAVGAVPDGGGDRWGRDSDADQLMRTWIATGAPAASPGAPTIVSLRITPAEQSFATGDSQQLCLKATYSDGLIRDATRRGKDSSNLDRVSSVDADALVTATGQSGEAAIIARYMKQVAMCRAMVSHGLTLEEIPDFQPGNYIDELAATKWKKLGLVPSATCDDSTFIRCGTIDFCGRLPTTDVTNQLSHHASF